MPKHKLSSHGCAWQVCTYNVDNSQQLFATPEPQAGPNNLSCIQADEGGHEDPVSTWPRLKKVLWPGAERLTFARYLHKQ